MPYITPDDAGTPKVVVLRVPDSPKALAALRGCLFDLMQPETWEQVHPSSLTPEDAALEWYQAFDDLDELTCDDL